MHYQKNLTYLIKGGAWFLKNDTELTIRRQFHKEIYAV